MNKESKCKNPKCCCLESETKSSPKSDWIWIVLLIATIIGLGIALYPALVE